MLPRAWLTALAVVLSLTAVSGQMVRPVALISGRALAISTTPLPNAIVRLRNLLTSQIEHTTKTNTLGEFTFAVLPDVPYVVEIADAAGRVIAVGDVVVARAGDVAAAVVTLPSRPPVVTGVFTDTAGAVIAAAASAGVAVRPKPPLLSPER